MSLLLTEAAASLASHGVSSVRTKCLRREWVAVGAVAGVEVVATGSTLTRALTSLIREAAARRRWEATEC